MGGKFVCTWARISELAAQRACFHVRWKYEVAAAWKTDRATRVESRRGEH